MDAEKVGMDEDLCVTGVILPFDGKIFPEAGGVEKI